MAYTTVLSYQMMIEEKLYSAMINAEQRSNYFIACGYADALITFLKISDAPGRPVGIKGNADGVEAYLEHYFELLNCIIKKETEIIADVRTRYGKGSKDIPITGSN